MRIDLDSSPPRTFWVNPSILTELRQDENERWVLYQCVANNVDFCFVTPETASRVKDYFLRVRNHK